MTTWFSLWPVLMIPSVLVFVAGLIPGLSFLNHTFGGGMVRQWLVNHVLIPILPKDWGWLLVDWYQAASVAQELVLHALVAINMNALLLPVLYLGGEGVIRLSGWSASSAFKAQRQQIK